MSLSLSEFLILGIYISHIAMLLLFVQYIEDRRYALRKMVVEEEKQEEVEEEESSEEELSETSDEEFTMTENPMFNHHEEVTQTSKED